MSSPAEARPSLRDSLQSTVNAERSEIAKSCSSTTYENSRARRVLSRGQRRVTFSEQSVLGGASITALALRAPRLLRRRYTRAPLVAGIDNGSGRIDGEVGECARCEPPKAHGVQRFFGNCAPVEALCATVIKCAPPKDTSSRIAPTLAIRALPGLPIYPAHAVDDRLMTRRCASSMHSACSATSATSVSNAFRSSAKQAIATDLPLDFDGVLSADRRTKD